MELSNRIAADALTYVTEFLFNPSAGRETFSSFLEDKELSSLGKKGTGSGDIHFHVQNMEVKDSIIGDGNTNQKDIKDSQLNVGDKNQNTQEFQTDEEA